MKTEITQSSCKDGQLCETDVQQSDKTWRRPQYELERNDDAFVLRAFVPGANKSGVRISVNEGLLTIEADRSDAVGENWKALSRPLSRADYRLEVRVPDTVDVSAIAASVADGILLLTLPFREASKPRSITVE